MLSTILIAVAVLTLGLYVGIAWTVVTKYRQTRNVGFLLLGAGVLLWPLLGRFLWATFGRTLIERGPGAAGVFPFSGVTGGGMSVEDFVAVSAYASHAVQAGFVLLGILLLGRAASGRHAAHSPSGHAG
jgi:hypothetical protein